MGILDLFGGRNAAGESGAKSRADDKQPSAIEYVDWLIGYMLRMSRTELTIDSKHPLPGSEGLAPDAAPPCLPDNEAVLNRLKILSGLNIVRHAKPVEGSFEKPREHHVLAITTLFHDGPDMSTCAIRVRIRPKS